LGAGGTGSVPGGGAVFEDDEGAAVEPGEVDEPAPGGLAVVGVVWLEPLPPMQPAVTAMSAIELLFTEASLAPPR
jgi:hypothetical protein